MLTLGFCSLLYFVLNAAAVSTAIYLVTGHSLKWILERSLRVSLLSRIAEALAAAVIFVNFQQISVLTLSLALPAALVFYYAHKWKLNSLHRAQQMAT